MNTFQIIRLLPFLAASTLAAPAPAPDNVIADDGSTTFTFPSGYEYKCPAGMTVIGASENIKKTMSSIKTSSSTTMSGGSGCPGTVGVITENEFVIPGGCGVDLGEVNIVGVEQPETVVVDADPVNEILLPFAPQLKEAGIDLENIDNQMVSNERQDHPLAGLDINSIDTNLLTPSVGGLDLAGTNIATDSIALPDVNMEATVLSKRSSGRRFNRPSPPSGTFERLDVPRPPSVPRGPDFYGRSSLELSRKDHISAVVPVVPVTRIQRRDIISSPCGCGVEAPIVSTSGSNEELIERLVTKKTSTNCGPNCGCECALGPEVSSFESEYESFPCPAPAPAPATCPIVNPPPPVIIETAVPVAPCPAPAPIMAPAPCPPIVAPAPCPEVACPEEILSKERYTRTCISTNCPCGSDWHGSCTETHTCEGPTTCPPDIVEPVCPPPVVVEPACPPAVVEPVCPPAIVEPSCPPPVIIEPACPPPAPVAPACPPSPCGEEVIEHFETHKFSSTCGNVCGCEDVCACPVVETCGEPFLGSEKYVRTSKSSNCPCTPGCDGAACGLKAAAVVEPVTEEWWRPCLGGVDVVDRV
ncbi:hypothetical protein EX30DRAFT_369130 [Ascodesmis nigricans]|uniref:Uncharacterized protein n=1 Tax=Ascodesmis nigricans TaxID=341454 RepID=A0A4S2N3J7_9PEZI|nr:hypothetical protein EX30DRAFT_369130 [Ascodesmis nigricans]